MTTPDPATLREALGDWTTDSPPPWQVKATVINAARWALDLIEGGKEVWWCNSTLAPRCRSDRPDPMGLGGHDSCQWVYIVPLGQKP